MTFNAASRLRSLEDRSAALGSSRCELPGMHSVPKSAVLPYASGVGGLSRRLLNNIYIYIDMYIYIPLTGQASAGLQKRQARPPSAGGRGAERRVEAEEVLLGGSWDLGTTNTHKNSSNKKPSSSNDIRTKNSSGTSTRTVVRIVKLIAMMIGNSSHRFERCLE